MHITNISKIKKLKCQYYNQRNNPYLIIKKCMHVFKQQSQNNPPHFQNNQALFSQLYQEEEKWIYALSAFHVFHSSRDFDSEYCKWQSCKDVYMYIPNIHFIDKLNTGNTTNNSGSSNLCKWQRSSVKKNIEKNREDHSCKSQVPKSTKSKYSHHYSLLVSYPV